MEKLIKAKKIKLAALIASIAFMIAALCGMALFAMKLLYLPLIICIAVAVAVIYAIPFLSVSIYDLRLCTKIIAEADDGALTAEEISERLCIKPEAVIKIINKYVRLGYITNTLA